MHGQLVLYMITTSLSYAQRWENTEIPIMEEWTMKIVELAEMVKVTCLIKEGTTIFIKTGNISGIFF